MTYRRHKQVDFASHLRFLVWIAIVTFPVIPMFGMMLNFRIQWSLSDFLAAGAILMSVGAATELSYYFIENMRTKIILIIAAAACGVAVAIGAALGHEF